MKLTNHENVTLPLIQKPVFRTIDCRNIHFGTSQVEYNINSQPKKLLNEQFDKHGEVFSDVPKTTNVYKHHIIVNEEDKFIRKIYPVPLYYQQIKYGVQECEHHSVDQHEIETLITKCDFPGDIKCKLQNVPEEQEKDQKFFKL